MIAIVRHYERFTITTRWPAWLISAVALAVAWLPLAFVTFVLIGITVTLGAMMLLLLPAALVAAGWRL